MGAYVNNSLVRHAVFLATGTLPRVLNQLSGFLLKPYVKRFYLVLFIPKALLITERLKR